MTTISIDHTWTNSTAQLNGDQRSIQFASNSSTRRGIDYAEHRENGSGLQVLLRGVRNLSATALSIGMVAMSFPAMSSGVTSNAAASQYVRALNTRSEDRRLELQALADHIRTFLESPYLEDQESLEAIQWATKDALSFMQIIPNDIDLPSVSHTDDGEIVMLWSNGDKRAEAAFPGTGELGYAMREQGQFVPGEEEGRPSSFPTDLLAYLRR